MLIIQSYSFECYIVIQFAVYWIISIDITIDILSVDVTIVTLICKQYLNDAVGQI